MVVLVLAHLGGDVVNTLVSDGLSLLEDLDVQLFLGLFVGHNEDETALQLVAVLKLFLGDVLQVLLDVVAAVLEHLE